MNDELVVLVQCQSVKANPEAIGTSLRMHCNDCGTPIWVAGSTLGLLADYPDRPVHYSCEKCVSLHEDEVDEWQDFTDDQLREALGYGMTRKALVESMALARMLRGRDAEVVVAEIREDMEQFLEFLGCMREAAERVRGL